MKGVNWKAIEAIIVRLATVALAAWGMYLSARYEKHADAVSKKLSTLNTSINANLGPQLPPTPRRAATEDRNGGIK